jgi:hypothetical protein
MTAELPGVQVSPPSADPSGGSCATSRRTFVFLPLVSAPPHEYFAPEVERITRKIGEYEGKWVKVRVYVILQDV